MTMTQLRGRLPTLHAYLVSFDLGTAQADGYSGPIRASSGLQWRLIHGRQTGWQMPFLPLQKEPGRVAFATINIVIRDMILHVCTVVGGSTLTLCGTSLPHR